MDRVNNHVVNLARHAVGMRTFDDLIDILTAARERRDLSQGDVARAVVSRGLRRKPHPSLVGNWEQKKADPGVGTLVAWADVLGFDVELIPRDDAQLRRSQPIVARAATLNDDELRALVRLAELLPGADPEMVDLALRTLLVGRKREQHRAGSE